MKGSEYPFQYNDNSHAATTVIRDGYFVNSATDVYQLLVHTNLDQKGVNYGYDGATMEMVGTMLDNNVYATQEIAYTFANIRAGVSKVGDDLVLNAFGIQNLAEKSYLAKNLGIKLPVGEQTTFTLAVNRRFQAKNADGTPTAAQQADFINCVAWRQAAEFLCRYFRKGSSVCITGAIQTRSWTDQHNVKRYATEVVADEIMFVESKSESGASTGAESTAQGSAVPPAINAVAPPNFEELKLDDDLPF